MMEEMENTEATQDDGQRTKALLALIKKMYRLMNKSDDEMKADLEAAGVDSEMVGSEGADKLEGMAHEMGEKMGDMPEMEEEDEDLKSFFKGRQPKPIAGTMTVVSVKSKKPQHAPTMNQKFGKQTGKR